MLFLLDHLLQEKTACTQGTKDCSHQACERAFSEADLPAPVKPSCDVALADSLLQERPVSEMILLTQSQILDIQNRKIIYFVLSFYILGKYKTRREVLGGGQL